MLRHIKEMNEHSVRLNLEIFHHDIGDVLRQLSLLFHSPALEGSYGYDWHDFSTSLL
jgi:hypothetical protein